MVERDNPYELIGPRYVKCTLKLLIKIIIIGCGTNGIVTTRSCDSTKDWAQEGSEGLPIPNNPSISL